MAFGLTGAVGYGTWTGTGSVAAVLGASLVAFLVPVTAYWLGLGVPARRVRAGRGPLFLSLRATGGELSTPAGTTTPSVDGASSFRTSSASRTPDSIPAAPSRPRSRIHGS